MNCVQFNFCCFLVKLESYFFCNCPRVELLWHSRLKKKLNEQFPTFKFNFFFQIPFSSILNLLLDLAVKKLPISFISHWILIESPFERYTDSFYLLQNMAKSITAFLSCVHLRIVPMELCQCYVTLKSIPLGRLVRKEVGTFMAFIKDFLMSGVKKKKILRKNHQLSKQN